MGLASAMAIGFAIVSILEIRQKQWPQALICLMFGTFAAIAALF